VLVGSYTSIDVGDGSGMNLMNIRSHQWDKQLLAFVDPTLEAKLGPPALGHSAAGNISHYFVSRCATLAYHRAF